MNAARSASSATLASDVQKLGVFVPIRFRPVRTRPGRHALGRAGDGMRLLRTRPYVPVEDSPRDIDKFSTPGQPSVIEWEAESGATVGLLVDVSASTATSLIAPLRNLWALQLTYSLGRAGDRPLLWTYDEALRATVKAANLSEQMRRTTTALATTSTNRGTDLGAAFAAFTQRSSTSRPHIVFVISDFAELSGNEALAVFRQAMPSSYRSIVPVVLTWRLPDTVRGAMKIVHAEHNRRRLAWFSRRRIRSVNDMEAQRVDLLIRTFWSTGLDTLCVAKQRDVFPSLVAFAKKRRSRR